MTVKLAEVAERAGISKACASFILTGHPTGGRFTPQTQAKVRQAARQLRYTPNALARGLTRKATSTVSLVLHYAELFSHWSGFPAEMMRGVSEAAFRLSYDVLLHTKGSSDPEGDAAAVADRRSEGALVFRHRPDALVDALRARDFPFVLMFCRSSERGVRWVDCDHKEGARMATDHLVRLGHRRIVHLTGDPESSDAIALRRQGFADALRKHRLPLRRDSMVDVGWEGAPDEQWDPFVRLLGSAERPTAVFGWYDGVALRAIRIARSLGLRVPQDLSVVGFDSTAICEQSEPRLTSVRQPIREIASSALDLLVSGLRDGSEGKASLLLNPKLDVRASCGPPPPAVLYSSRPTRLPRV
jgi:DNA-binding LacI/PurR family transcriptional regulator